MPEVPEPIAVEARAKIMWGESPAKVHAFLISKNVGEQDAAVLLEAIIAERAESIRSDGTKKIWIGALCVAVPIAYYLVTHFLLGHWTLRGFTAPVVLGVVGIAMITQGVFMVFRSKTMSGDLSNAAD